MNTIKRSRLRTNWLINQSDVVATLAAATGVATLYSDMVDSVHTNSPVGPWKFRFLTWKVLQSIVPESLAACLECLQTLRFWRNGSSLYTRTRPSTQMYRLNYLTCKQPSFSCTSYYKFCQSPFIYLDFLNDPPIKQSIYHLLDRSWLLQLSSFRDMLLSSLLESVNVMNFSLTTFIGAAFVSRCIHDGYDLVPGIM